MAVTGKDGKVKVPLRTKDAKELLPRSIVLTNEDKVTRIIKSKIQCFD